MRSWTVTTPSGPASYASPEVVKAVREGKPIPNGTVLVMAIFAAKADDKGVPARDGGGRFSKDKPIGVTVMEKRAGWGASVPEAWRNGDWQYASFTADGKPNEKANAGIRACFECRLPHAESGTVRYNEVLLGMRQVTLEAGLRCRRWLSRWVSVGRERRVCQSPFGHASGTTRPTPARFSITVTPIGLSFEKRPPPSLAGRFLIVGFGGEDRHHEHGSVRDRFALARAARYCLVS